MIIDFIHALSAGKELKNAETWKNAQLLTNCLTTLLTSAVALAPLVGVTIPLTEPQIVSLASGVFPVVILFNWIATAVSSKRVGILPSRRPVQPSGTDDGGGYRDVPGQWIRELDNRYLDPLPDLKDDK